MSKQLPKSVISYLEKVRDRLGGNRPLDFWEWANTDALVSGFMELGAQLELGLSNGDTGEEWPVAYRYIMYLFTWEAWGQSDGWSQFFDAPEAMIDAVSRSYRFVQLQGEAEAMLKAREAVNAGASEEKVGVAYRQLRHDYSHDLERLAYLANWFRENADFYLYKI